MLDQNVTQHFLLVFHSLCVSCQGRFKLEDWYPAGCISPGIVIPKDGYTKGWLYQGMVIPKDGFIKG